jgi:hypothetical protein
MNTALLKCSALANVRDEDSVFGLYLLKYCFNRNGNSLVRF